MSTGAPIALKASRSWRPLGLAMVGVRQVLGGARTAGGVGRLPRRLDPLAAAAKRNGLTVADQRELAKIHANLLGQELRDLERGWRGSRQLGAMQRAFVARWVRA